MWNHYYTARDVDEVLELLAQYGANARLIAGGTDVMVELYHGKKTVDALIDISRIPGLSDIEIVDDVVTLGPLVTHNHVVGEKQLTELALPLVQACWEVGAPQIRNRATIAGNVITASPANDTITPLMALGASVTLASATSGERQMALSDFYTGFRQTVRRPDELLTAITFPALDATNQRGAFIKLGLRRAQAISVVNAAAVLTFSDDMVSDAIITLGSVAPQIIRVQESEDMLRGQILTPARIAETARVAAGVPKPIDDVRGTADYRSEMIGVLIKRILTRILEGDKAITWGEAPAMLWGKDQAKFSVALPDSYHHQHDVPIETTINGERVVLESGQHLSLLDLLRDHVQLKGTKEGCAEGECGACTVLLDDAAVMSCMVPAPRAHQAEIVTIEGLAAGDLLHPLQQSFVNEGAVQCGFCTPGFIMAGAKLLDEHPHPSQEQIQQSISGNLCRCTGYYKILKAFQDASQKRE